MSVKLNLPIKLDGSIFASYSYSKVHTNDVFNYQPKRRSILIGGCGSTESGFYEFIFNDEENSIVYKSFQNDYSKQFANLKCIGMKNLNAANTHSYLIQDNKYLAVFHCNTYSDMYYNVYDMESDEWLINRNNVRLIAIPNLPGKRSVLINEEIIIVSISDNLYFYFIGKDCITNPQLVYKCKLATQDVSFINHAMCVIDVDTVTVIKQDSIASKNKSAEKHKVKIILFGGDGNRDSLSSFLILDIVLSYSYDCKDKKSLPLIKVSINEHLVDKSSIRLKNITEDEDGHQVNTKYYYPCDFGYTCIWNSRNEPILMIIGGLHTERDIHLFNCVTYEFTRKSQVMFDNS